MKFGKLVKTARVKNGWSMRELGSIAKVSYNNISLLEASETRFGNANLSTVYKLSTSLNLNLEDVISEYLTFKFGKKTEVKFPTEDY